MNAINSLKNSSKSLAKEISQSNSSSEEAIPFELIKAKIMQFPNALAQKSTWEINLLLAKRNAEIGQYGLSVLVLYEAIIEKFAKKYNLDRTSEADQKKIRGQISAYKNPTRNNNSTIPSFKKNFTLLKKLRNQVAHADSSSEIIPERFITTYKNQLDYFEKFLLNANGYGFDI